MEDAAAQLARLAGASSSAPRHASASARPALLPRPRSFVPFAACAPSPTCCSKRRLRSHRRRRLRLARRGSAPAESQPVGIAKMCFMAPPLAFAMGEGGSQVACGASPPPLSPLVNATAARRRRRARRRAAGAPAAQRDAAAGRLPAVLCGRRAAASARRRAAARWRARGRRRGPTGLPRPAPAAARAVVGAARRSQPMGARTRCTTGRGTDPRDRGAGGRRGG